VREVDDMNAKNADERMIERKIDDAKSYAYETKDKFDVLVADHPLAFVVGAFVGGLLVGKMLSNRA